MALISYTVLPSAGSEKNNKIASLLIKRESSNWSLPVFMLYEDRTVIFSRNSPYRNSATTPKYFTCKLNPFRFQHELSLARGMEGLNPSYEATKLTDQYQFCIDAHSKDSRQISVCVYAEPNLGLGKSSSRLLSDRLHRRHCLNKPEAVPQAFLLAYKEFFNFDSPDAIRWLPDRIECNSIEAPVDVASVRWPKDLPNLAEGSFELSASQFEEFEKLRQSNEYFESSGRKWSISFRFRFPD